MTGFPHHIALTAFLLLGAAGAVAQPSATLSADGTQVEVSGRLSTVEGITILHLDVPTTVVAHVANVIEPIASVERALQVRAASAETARALADTARAQRSVMLSGRLWWAGATDGTANYVIDAVGITPGR